MPINDVEMPGRRLAVPLAGKLQRCFVERFVPEMLPRLAPPYWGATLERATKVRSCWLREPAFAQRGPVLCLMSRGLPKPAPRYARAVYLCAAADLAQVLTSIHWSVHCDFYVFDRTLQWFVAVLEERVFQMDEEGEYVVLVHREDGAALRLD